MKSERLRRGKAFHKRVQQDWSDHAIPVVWYDD